jgi:anti-sigma B factor antagonist
VPLSVRKSSRFAGQTRAETEPELVYLGRVGATASNGVAAARDAGVRSFPLSRSVRLLAPAGELDLYVAADLRQQISSALADGVQRLVVDLLDVTFIDSTALGVLADAAKRVRANAGSLAVVCRDRNILKVLEITGLSRLFRIYDTIPEAVAEGSRVLRAEAV